jgi:hypothetical protein
LSPLASVTGAFGELMSDLVRTEPEPGVDSRRRFIQKTAAAAGAIWVAPAVARIERASAQAGSPNPALGPCQGQCCPGDDPSCFVVCSGPGCPFGEGELCYCDEFCAELGDCCPGHDPNCASPRKADVPVEAPLPDHITIKDNGKVFAGHDAHGKRVFVGG